MDCIFQKPQIQLHEIANYSANATVEYLEERLLLAIKSFNGENPRSIKTQVRINCMLTLCRYLNT